MHARRPASFAVSLMQIAYVFRTAASALRSLENGIAGSAIGMLGKVWSSGALAVIQNVAIIPGCVHPRDKLDGERPPPLLSGKTAC